MALAADTGTVNTDCVRLRREATTSSDSLGMLVNGQKVSILEQEDNGWLKITYTDAEGSHTGYISSEFVQTGAKSKKTKAKTKTETKTDTTKQEQDTPAEETKTAEQPKQEAEQPVSTQQAPADTSAVALGTGTVINNGKTYSAINLRAAASKDAKVLCKIPVDTSVEVLSDLDDAGWLQIRYTDADETVYSGYMLGKYVQTAVTSQPTAAATVIATKKTHTAINIRAEKSMDADIVFQVPVGGTLDVIAAADAEGWYQVSYTDATGTYNGYMREEYVDPDNTTASKLTGVVTTKKAYINLRAGQSTDAEVLCKVPAGKTVTLTTPTAENGWYAVRYKDDQGTHKGYMMSKYIAVTSVSTGNIGTSTAVLRSAADNGSDMLCVIPQGNKVSILSTLGDWYQVEYDGNIGYVDANCIDSEALSQSKGYGTVTVDTLHVRAKRSTDSTILTNMAKGDTFQILGSKNGWYTVSFNGVDGYVKAEYAAASDTVSSGYVQVTSSSLNLRSGAGTDYDQLTVVPYGTLLKVRGSMGSWYKVKYNGHVGYVCGDYTSSTTSSGFKAYPDFARITASALGLRSEPATDANKICTIPKDTVVAVQGLKNGWYTVVVYGTQKGYIDASYTTESKGPATVLQAPAQTTNSAAANGTTSTTTSSGGTSSSSSSTTSTSSGGGSGAAVLAYAQQFVGNPYKWGGTSLTNGADCSGFVQSVYAHFGKSLPHSSYADAHVGKAVSRSDMRVGDIVVYDGHVGIYAGGGKLLSALGKKYGITYCSVNYKPIQTVRRLM